MRLAVREENPSPAEEAAELEADYPWANAIDHKFCKKCRPHAIQLTVLFGKAIRVIRRLRGSKI